MLSLLLFFILSLYIHYDDTISIIIAYIEMVRSLVKGRRISYALYSANSQVEADSNCILTKHFDNYTAIFISGAIRNMV